MAVDQLMTLTANKYKNMMIQNQCEEPSPHDATIQVLQSKVEKLQWELEQAPKITQHNHNAPNGWPTKRNPKLDNFPTSGYGTETNSIGASKKQETNVMDTGSITLPQVAKGGHLKVSIKRGCRRNHLNQSKLKRKARERKKPMMKRKGSTSDLTQLSPLLTMRLTIPVRKMNEDGGGKVIGQPTYLS